MGRQAAFRHADRGNAAIEFALIAPLVVVLFAGVVEFGRAFQVYNATNKLASQYAIAWADCSDRPAGTCQLELNTYTSTTTIANIAPQLSASRLTLQMFQVTMAGSTPTVVYAYPTGATLTAAQTAAAQAAIPSGQTGVVVATTYAHALSFFPALMNTALGSRLTASYVVAQLKS